MNYQIVTSGFPEKLVESVNEHISDGWLPVGGVSVAINDYHCETETGEERDNRTQLFAQAMVKPQKAERKIISRAFTG